MIKYAIRSRDNKNDVIILHALPGTNYKNIKLQWYVSDKPNIKGTPIKKQIYESFTLNVQWIKKNNYLGKYIYCSITNQKGEHTTEYIYLGENINNMVEHGVEFDNISMFDDKGNICSEPVESVKEVEVKLYSNSTTDEEPIHTLEYDGVKGDIIGKEITDREAQIFKLAIDLERERIWDESAKFINSDKKLENIMNKLVRNEVIVCKNCGWAGYLSDIVHANSRIKQGIETYPNELNCPNCNKHII